MTCFSGRPLPGRIFWCQESWLWTFECKLTVWQVKKSREFQEVEKDHDTQSFVPSWSYRKGLDDSLAEGIGCGSRKFSRKLVGPVLISVLFACSMFTQCVCPVRVHRPVVHSAFTFLMFSLGSSDCSERNVIAVVWKAWSSWSHRAAQQEVSLVQEFWAWASHLLWFSGQTQELIDW